MSRGLAVDDAAWSSAWRTRSPGDKALLSLGLVLVALLAPAWPTAPLVAVTAAALAVGPARVPARTFARACRVPLGFVAVGSVPIAVDVVPASESAGWPWALSTSQESLARAADVAAHAVAGTLAMLLLATTTPVSDLLPRLRSLGVPAAVIDVAAVMYRLLFGLAGSVHAVREAQSARLGYAGRRRALRSAAGLTTSVLLRSWERARRLEAGLAGRGEGDLAVLPEARPSSPRFVALTAVLLAALSAVAVLSALATGLHGRGPGT